MTPRPPFKSARMALPVALLVVSMCSFQVGAVVAKQLFPVVGAAGATALRLGLSGVILLTVWRPWRLRFNRREGCHIAIYGLAMGAMNFFFYASLDRIPLGIAVALEFAGPLAVAMAASRRLVDFLWIGFAAFGLAALLPFGIEQKPLDSVGVAYALVAGVCWGIYIVFGQKAGSAHGGQTTALGALIGAVAIVPIGIAHAGTALFSPGILPAAVAVALLSTALPYSLEMYALMRIPTRTFGVLMSGDPALGALSGLIFLHESLSAIQWTAIFSIVLASAGSAYTGRAAPQAALPE